MLVKKDFVHAALSGSIAEKRTKQSKIPEKYTI